MFNLKNSFSSLGLSLGLVIGMSSVTYAHTAKITSLSEFYTYYDATGTVFTQPQKNIIGGIFNNIEPYLGANGLQEAIAAGFIPLTQELRGHGTHWFNPTFINLGNIQANPLLPSGLNFDADGNLAGVFWAQELYQPIVSLVQSLDLTTLTPATLTQMYTQYKQATEQPEPTIFDAFGSTVQWHHHTNVVIENLGARNAQGELDAPTVRFRQSLLDQNFVNELLVSLANPGIVVAPLETDNSLGYPPFNRALSPGFQMIHMWVGQGNHAGLFADTNASIEVSANAIDEAITFEDGQVHTGHGDHGHIGTNGSPSVPEPSVLLGLFGLTLLPLKKRLTK